jgi:hypothetical protein
MSRLFRPFLFSPLAHLQEPDITYLSNRFNEQGVAPVFPLYAWLRRGAWATTLPMGVFINDFRPGAVTQETHAKARDAIYVQYRTTAREHGVSLRPHDPSLKAVTHDGLTFYHLEVIRFLRTQVTHPALLNALYGFLLDAGKNRALIIPKRPRTPYVPRERRKEVFGLKHVDSCRGPGWTPEEDAVLRRWFGMHTSGEHEGRHASLTSAMWQRVLDVELAGRRTKQSVQNRFVLLNEQLLKEYQVDGYIPVTRIREYMQRAVGERPRVPPTRPRRKAAPSDQRPLK